MNDMPPSKPVPLEAGSPFELRVEMASNVSESVIKEALNSGDIGFLHSFTTGSTVDGPGVRVVGWTAGCQWRCLYCHNPDTWSLTNGMPVPITRAIEELGKYRHGLRIMSGGFTLSGGEPLLQDRFAVRLFTAVHGMGIHTALDTNGALGDRLSDKELDQIDLVLLDIKMWDEEGHLKLTGRDNGPTKEFARRLASRNQPAWLRYVLVPGLTDNFDDIAQIARFVSSLGNFERVDVLPFHQMGRFKWKQLNLNYTLDDVAPPSSDLIERVCEVFRGEGLKAY